MITLEQRPPNYGLRAKSGPRSHSIRPAKPFHPGRENISTSCRDILSTM